MSEKIKKPRKLNDTQLIILRFLPKMSGCRDGRKWAYEGAFVKKFVAKYGLPFMMWVKPPAKFEVDSFLAYSGAWGSKFFDERLTEFKKLQDDFFKSPTEQIKTEIPLAENKIGDDVITAAKPRTLKEFLNYGKTLKLASGAERTVEETVGISTQ